MWQPKKTETQKHVNTKDMFQGERSGIHRKDEVDGGSLKLQQPSKSTTLNFFVAANTFANF